MQIVKTDAQIQKDVLEELKWDTRIAATEVGVEVDKGVVTLTGTVDSHAKKYAGRQAAHRVAGVLDVADDVQVILPSSGKRTDTDVAEAVRNALIWDTFLPEDLIRSTVADGWVTLEGEVDRWSQRADAERAIRNLHGVRGVLNQIQIKATKVEPQAVRRSIEAALERRAESEAQRIRVFVDNGTVTLSGSVHDWAEESAIVRAAAHALGVRSVKSDLRIDFSLR
jgi:osmotically-inducible protein OsmY